MMKFASEWAFSALLRDHRARYSTKIDFSMHHTKLLPGLLCPDYIGGQEVLGLLCVFLPSLSGSIFHALEYSLQLQH